MLLKFKVKNFRSIKDEIEISFEAANYKEHPNNVASIDGIGDILKSTVFYGANASGKSNLLKAMEAIKFFCFSSVLQHPNEEIGVYEPFILEKSFKKEPVFFEIEFFAKDGIKYSYSISFTEFEIEFEILKFAPKGKYALLFHRNKGDVAFGEYFKGEKKSIQRSMLKNQSFLSNAIINNVGIIRTAFSFLYSNLSFYSNFEDVSFLFHYDRIAQLLLDKNKQFSSRYRNIISAFDTGIFALEPSEITDYKKSSKEASITSKKQSNSKKQYELKTYHKHFIKNDEFGLIEFDTFNESEGTQGLMLVAGLILEALAKGSVLVIDEFERNLHPHITKTLIKMFHDPRINKKNAQLIFATHDITQLDNEVFRRDQIWFTEKDEYGATSAFSLAEFSDVRATTPFDKWYTNGQFGGTPIIDELAILFEDDEEE
jgi:uncharacterized protein